MFFLRVKILHQNVSFNKKIIDKIVSFYRGILKKFCKGENITEIVFFIKRYSLYIKIFIRNKFFS